METSCAIDTSSRRVCEKVKTLSEIGYRHFVVTPTYYIAIKTPEEHLRLFGQAKEAAGNMEMIAYNIPQCTASTLAIETICKMAQRGWIRCCKPTLNLSPPDDETFAPPAPPET